MKEAGENGKLSILVLKTLQKHHLLPSEAHVTHDLFSTRVHPDSPTRKGCSHWQRVSPAPRSREVSVTSVCVTKVPLPQTVHTVSIRKKKEKKKKYYMKSGVCVSPLPKV